MWWRKKTNVNLPLESVGDFTSFHKHNTVNRYDANKKKYWNCFNFKHIHKMAHKKWIHFIYFAPMAENVWWQSEIWIKHKQISGFLRFYLSATLFALMFYWIATTERVLWIASDVFFWLFVSQFMNRTRRQL